MHVLAGDASLRSMDYNAHYNQGLCLLNNYLTCKARAVVTHPPVCFAGPQNSVMRKIECESAPNGQPPNSQEFLAALKSAEDFYAARACSILQNYCDSVINSNTVTGALSHLVTAFALIIDPVPGSTTEHQAGRVLIGFVFLSKLVEHHANRRAQLDVLAVVADVFLRRCVINVVQPLGGWNATVRHCVNDSTLSLWQCVCSYFRSVTNHNGGPPVHS